MRARRRASGHKRGSNRQRSLGGDQPGEFDVPVQMLAFGHYFVDEADFRRRSARPSEDIAYRQCQAGRATGTSPLPNGLVSGNGPSPL
jgi:hypothetical protein